MKNTLILTLAVLALSTGYAVAQEAQSEEKRPHKGMGKLDLNGDGVVSKSEFLAHAEERFSKIDKDGSGDISKDEGKTAHKAMRARKKEFMEKRKERQDNRPDRSSESE